MPENRFFEHSVYHHEITIIRQLGCTCLETQCILILLTAVAVQVLRGLLAVLP